MTYTLNEMAGKLKISESTVLTELRDINRNLPEDEKIIVKNRKMSIRKTFSSETLDIIK